eukprot:scaffold408_cov388-Prasinococcus_capsulatus_cf.AAC.3
MELLASSICMAMVDQGCGSAGSQCRSSSWALVVNWQHGAIVPADITYENWMTVHPDCAFTVNSTADDPYNVPNALVTIYANYTTAPLGTDVMGPITPWEMGDWSVQQPVASPHIQDNALYVMFGDTFLTRPGFYTFEVQPFDAAFNSGPSEQYYFNILVVDPASTTGYDHPRLCCFALIRAR